RDLGGLPAGALLRFREPRLGELDREGELRVPRFEADERLQPRVLVVQRPFDAVRAPRGGLGAGTRRVHRARGLVRTTLEERDAEGADEVALLRDLLRKTLRGVLLGVGVERFLRPLHLHLAARTLGREGLVDRL